MRVSVDTEKCVGHARCNAYGPRVYDLDDDGYCLIHDPEVPLELEAEARHGAHACPERAITVEE